MAEREEVARRLAAVCGWEYLGRMGDVNGGLWFQCYFPDVMDPDGCPTPIDRVRFPSEGCKLYRHLAFAGHVAETLPEIRHIEHIEFDREEGRWRVWIGWDDPEAGCDIGNAPDLALAAALARLKVPAEEGSNDA